MCFNVHPISHSPCCHLQLGWVAVLFVFLSIVCSLFSLGQFHLNPPNKTPPPPLPDPGRPREEFCFQGGFARMVPCGMMLTHIGVARHWLLWSLPFAPVLCPAVASPSPAEVIIAGMQPVLWQWTIAFAPTGSIPANLHAPLAAQKDVLCQSACSGSGAIGMGWGEE